MSIIRTGGNSAGQASDVVVPVSYAASITIDAALGRLFRVTATGNLSVTNITNGFDGQLIALEVRATGADRSLTIAGITQTVPAGQKWTAWLRFDQSLDEWLLLEVGGGSSGGSSSDAQLRDRSTHTGTQLSSTISDFTEAAQDSAAAMLTAGSHTGLTATYVDGSNRLDLAVTGGSGTQVSVDGAPVSTLALDSTAAVFNDLSDAATLRAVLFGGSARTQKPFFAARLAANLSIANNTSTLVPNSSLTVAKDTDTAWSTTNSTYTIPVNGFYRIRFFSAWATNGAGSRFSNITLNSTAPTTGSIGEAAATGSTVPVYQTIIIDARLLSVGDVLRCYVYQDSGGALNQLAGQSGGVGAAITIEWMRPA